MKNAAMNFRSMPSNLRRVLTLLVVFAIVLVTLPLQANAQEWSTTSTTAYDTADEDDWATESTSEPVEQPSTTSKASKTSAAHPDDYTEEPTLTEEAIEPFDELAGTLWPSDTAAPANFGGFEEAELLPESDSNPAAVPGPQAFRSALRMMTSASDTYTGTSDVDQFWWDKRRTSNNEIQPRCGLKVGLVFDLSGSIGENGLRNSKLAGKRVVETLRGSAGTQLGIFSFNTRSETLHPGFNMVTQANEANAAIENLRIGQGNSAGTNWEGGLKQVNDAAAQYGSYDIVYFITDGVPTTNNTANYAGSPWQDYGSIPHNGDIARAIDQANILKGDKTRLEVLAVNMDESRHPVLRDEATLHSSSDWRTLYVNDLGSFNNQRELNENGPNYRWSAITINDTQAQNAIAEGALIQYTTKATALGGADVTAQRKNGRVTVTGVEGYYYRDFYLPKYNVNQPKGRHMALSLTDDPLAVTNVNYDQLAEKLEEMLPAPCIANVVVEKNVVDQFGNKDSSVSLKDWEFEFGKLPSGFTYQSGYQSKVKTDNNGRAEWRFNTSTPNENGKVDITELVKANVDSQLQKVVCTDRQDAEIPVEVNGQKFSIKMVAGQTYTCEVVNQIPGFEVSKRAAADQNPDIEGDQPVAGVKADGSFTAFYHIDVQNLSKSQNTLTKRVVDTLVYPEGFTANEVIFTMNGNRVNATYRNGSYEIPATAFTRFNANETKTIDVEVRGTANDAARQSLNDDTYVGCEASGGPKTGGLLNKVSMEGDKDKTNNEACVDVTVLDVLLKLLKVDHNNVNQALTGAEFALYTAVNGQMGEKVTDFTVGGADGSHETRIAVGGEYFIVETKAPDSYSLLPAPVHIRVDTAADGSLDLVVLNPNEAFSVEPKESDDSKYVILQVADLQSGALPKSGGMGVVPFTVVALLILGLGAFMLRRRM